jgi:hypothetical protein
MVIGLSAGTGLINIVNADWAHPRDAHLADGQLFTRLLTSILPSPVAKSQAAVAGYASIAYISEVERIPYSAGEGS